VHPKNIYSHPGPKLEHRRRCPQPDHASWTSIPCNEPQRLAGCSGRRPSDRLRPRLVLDIGHRGALGASREQAVTPFLQPMCSPWSARCAREGAARQSVQSSLQNVTFQREAHGTCPIPEHRRSIRDGKQSITEAAMHQPACPPEGELKSQLRCTAATPRSGMRPSGSSV